MGNLVFFYQVPVEACIEEVVVPPPTAVPHASDQPGIGTSSDIEEDGGDPLEEFTSEDSLRKSQKVNSVASITSLRMKPHAISRLRIPLCRLVQMPMVRPALKCDLIKLEQQYVHGYLEGSSVFYVSITNEQGEEELVTDNDKASWGPNWIEENDVFNALLRVTPELQHLQNSKFFVCDGNHRLLAWSSYIAHHHPADRDWHVSVDAIILETKGRIGSVMHDINK